MLRKLGLSLALAAALLIPTAAVAGQREHGGRERGQRGFRSAPVQRFQGRREFRGHDRDRGRVWRGDRDDHWRRGRGGWGWGGGVYVSPYYSPYYAPNYRWTYNYPYWCNQFGYCTVYPPY